MESMSLGLSTNIDHGSHEFRGAPILGHPVLLGIWESDAPELQSHGLNQYALT